MRTKAEAAANPLAGDRWEKPDGTWRAILKNLGNGWIKWRCGGNGKTVSRWTNLRNFTKWIAGADYAGGAYMGGGDE